MADGCSRWESEEERKCSLVKISKISSASVNYSGVCLNNSHENDELKFVAKSGDFFIILFTESDNWMDFYRIFSSFITLELVVLEPACFATRSELITSLTLN